MNTMEKPAKTMKKSMNHANGKFEFQNSATWRFLLQNVANGKEKCSKLKTKNISKKKRKYPRKNPQPYIYIYLTVHGDLALFVWLPSGSWILFKTYFGNPQFRRLLILISSPCQTQDIHEFWSRRNWISMGIPQFWSRIFQLWNLLQSLPDIARRVLGGRPTPIRGLGYGLGEVFIIGSRSWKWVIHQVINLLIIWK